MQNLLEELKKLLEQDERLVVEGKLLKNKIIESALKLNIDLIRLLLKSETIKAHFFQEVDGVLVFDKIKFQKFVNNKTFLPDNYTSFKNEIGLVTENEEYLSESKEAVLVWPYKDCILEGGQEKEAEKRDEIFYNEILAPDEIDRLAEPKVLTNFKKIDKNGEHKITEINKNDNLIIRGNNLLALYSLQKRFDRKVKLIYIDPPYNTGGDGFNYNDTFNHSSWLTFMKNRLKVAIELLGEKGVVFVQIDDNEQAYLKVLLDEIFKKYNLLNICNICVKVTSESGIKVTANKPVRVKEYILIYGNREGFTYKRQYVKSGYDSNYKYFVENRDDSCLKWEIKNIKDKFIEVYTRNPLEEDLLNFQIKNKDKIFSVRDISEKLKKISGKNPNEIIEYVNDAGKKTLLWKKGEIVFIEKKVREINGEVCLTKHLSDFWNDISWDGIAKEGGVTLKKGKKPEALLRRIIDMMTEKDEIVLDFFLGTGTTCAVAHKMGRKYIGIEQLDYGENDSVVRLKNVINGDQSGISKPVNWQGGGDFIYCELMKLNEKYIDEIEEVKTTNQLLDIWKKMKEKAFLSYKVNVKKFDENVNEFEELDLENQKKFLIECLDKNQLYINLSEIDDTEYEISEEDKKLNKLFYGVI